MKNKLIKKTENSIFKKYILKSYLKEKNQIILVNQNIIRLKRNTSSQNKI